MLKSSALFLCCLGLVSQASDAAEAIPAHIESAPAGQWTAIGTNVLEDVRYDYNINPPPDGYRTSLKGIMTAWSGAAYDNKNHRLIVHGGGHRDYDGNEFYSFDLVENRWTRLNSPTLLLESAAVEGVFPDSTPIPVHTYDMLEMDSTTSKVYRLESGGSVVKSIWSFSLSDLRWTDTGVALSDLPGNGTNSSSAWDPTNSKFWIADADQGTWIRFGSFDPEINRAVGFSTSLGIAKSGQLTSTLRYTENKDPQLLTIANDASIVVWEVGTSNASLIEVPALGSGAGRGIAYDHRRDVIWIYDDKSPGLLKRIDLASWEVSEITPGGDTPSMPESTNGVFGRFRYDPELDILLTVNRVDDRVYIYKPVDWQTQPIVRPLPPSIN